MTNPAHPSWVQTASGIQFDLLNPTPEMIQEIDISLSLAHQARFNGHTSLFYSVAQHSVAVSVMLEEAGFSGAVQLQGLLHDATEAYLGDVPTPLKALLPEYKTLEDRVWLTVAERFGMDPKLHTAVKWADEELLMHEAQLLLPGGPRGWGRKPRTELPTILRETWGHWQAQVEFDARLKMLQARLLRGQPEPLRVILDPGTLRTA